MRRLRSWLATVWVPIHVCVLTGVSGCGPRSDSHIIQESGWELHGVITSNHTGAPLESVAVAGAWVFGDGAHWSVLTSSDSIGAYHCDGIGAMCDSVRFTREGYEPIRIPLPSGAILERPGKFNLYRCNAALPWLSSDN